MNIRRTRIGRRLTLGSAAAIASIGLLLAAPMAASAAQTKSGTAGCNAQYGWSTGSTTGLTTISPPGTQANYNYTSGGTRTVVALWATGGISKPGGGNWWVQSNDTVPAASGFCRTYG